MSILFVAVAVCAIQIATCLVGIDLSTTTLEGILICASTSLFGGIIGGIIGLHSHQRMVRMISGSVVGLVIGLSAGFMVFADEDAIPRIITTQILGCVGIVLFAVYFKIAGSDPLWKDGHSSLHEIGEEQSPFADGS